MTPSAEKSPEKSSEKSSIVLLDGGMGQELITRHSGPPTPLWSARVMLEAPERVYDVHMENIRAGARAIGGCCEVSPAHIAAIAARLERAGYQIKGTLNG